MLAGEKKRKLNWNFEWKEKSLYGILLFQASTVSFFVDISNSLFCKLILIIIKKVKRGNTWFYFSPNPFSSVKSIFESDRKNNVKQASGLWYLCFIKFCMKSIQMKYLINNTTIFGLWGYYPIKYQSNICWRDEYHSNI